MCMAIQRTCHCGRETANLHHTNSILPEEAVKNIYCPACSEEIRFEPETMLRDNGWIIEYDMAVTCLYAARMGLAAEEVNPERIFDEGFCTWQGFTPNDLPHANREKAELAEVARTDMKRYLKLIREWSIQRARQLREEGWRKARETVDV